MRFSDYLKAIGVAIAALALIATMSFMLAALYAFLIEPGHERGFYLEVLQAIAPWSSHITGPIAFFALNYWLAIRSPERNAIAFAITTVVAYLIIDLSILTVLGGDNSIYLTLSAAFWVILKFAGAILGTHIGSLQAGDRKL